MAANYVQPGNTVPLTAPYDVDSGNGALINGNLFGIAINDVLSGVEGEFALVGVWDLLAQTADVFAQGANVYWDDAAKKADSSSSGATLLIGVAIEAKAADETTVRVRLNGVSI